MTGACLSTYLTQTRIYHGRSSWVEVGYPVRSAFSQLSAPNPVITSIPPTMPGQRGQQLSLGKNEALPRVLQSLAELAFHLEPLGDQGSTPPTTNSPTLPRILPSQEAGLAWRTQLYLCREAPSSPPPVRSRSSI